MGVIKSTNASANAAWLVEDGCMHLFCAAATNKPKKSQEPPASVEFARVTVCRTKACMSCVSALVIWRQNVTNVSLVKMCWCPFLFLCTRCQRHGRLEQDEQGLLAALSFQTFPFSPCSCTWNETSRHGDKCPKCLISENRHPHPGCTRT